MALAGCCTYCLGLADPIPAHLVELISDRFGPVTVSTAGGLAFLDGRMADQPAVRSLLTLVWDAGAELRLLVVSDDPTSAEGSER